MTDMITVAEDDHWKFLRSTMTPTFTTGKLKNVCRLSMLAGFSIIT